MDLKQATDLDAFLGAQLEVLSTIQPRPGPHAGAVRELRACMTAALGTDLRDLGRERVRSPGASREVDATSALYILLGSRLGMRVLHRRWLEATDAAVASAGRYLGLPTPAPAWRDFCAELTRLPADGPDADRVVADACFLFGLHLDALSNLAPARQGEFHAA